MKYPTPKCQTLNLLTQNQPGKGQKKEPKGKNNDRKEPYKNTSGS
jgi:hypothetical protein